MSNQIDPYSGDVPRHDSKLFARYISEVTRLAAEGKPVQYKYLTLEGWNLDTAANWQWNAFDYRIDPASKPHVMRPWAGPDDVPKGPAVWIRSKTNHFQHFLVWQIERDGILFASRTHPCSWPLMTDYEYSLARITWKPCEVEVTP